jgi:hypothetical protein
MYPQGRFSAPVPLRGFLLQPIGLLEGLNEPGKCIGVSFLAEDRYDPFHLLDAIWWIFDCRALRKENLMHGIFRLWWCIMALLLFEGLLRDRQEVIQAIKVGLALPRGAAGRCQGTRLFDMLRFVSLRFFGSLLVNEVG